MHLGSFAIKGACVRPQRRWKDKGRPPEAERSLLTSSSPPLTAHLTSETSSPHHFNPPQTLITFWDVSPLRQCL